MKPGDVIALMESSKTPQEWNANCKAVKQAFGGNYPPYWYEEIIATGLADRIIKAAGYPDGAAITILDAFFVG